MEGHSGFEDGRLGAGELEFEVGADDAGFDVASARFSQELVGEVVLNADERSWRNASAQRPAHVVQIDFVLEVLLLQVLVVTAIRRLWL